MISLKGKRIVLVGGAGFIGHHLALALKKAGAEPHVVDSLQVNNLLSFTPTLDIPNGELYLKIIHERLELLRQAGIPVHIQDARDYHALSRIMNQVIKPHVVIQLAAVAHANRSNKDPYSTFDHSLRTLENALDSSREIEHFIYFSSSMVYGNFPDGFVTEDSPCEPLGIYGALKFAGEKLVIAYNQVFNLPYTIIRPSALYGERCVSRRVGQIFIENAIQGLDVSISGDGSDALDFTYIDDLVNGVLRIIENPKAKNQIFNITCGKARSINEMAEIIRQHFPNVKIKNLPKDNLMPDRGTLSIEKAERLIGYKSEFPLEVGFLKYIEWYKSLWSDGKMAAPKNAHAVR